GVTVEIRVNPGASRQPPSAPTSWIDSSFEGRPLAEALRAHDVAMLFQYLKTRGWSRAAIAAATGMSETRVREVIQRRRKVTSYDVLERIAVGLSIDRGLMGLAYIPCQHDESSEHMTTFGSI
ncbi:MAG: helix-turn-helix transcriptional regulator, partial [Micromonosporaceae bacterium]|nr:helix-turn-helix transcriptional regulator [Micromonosporaceae bacterium]